MLELLIDLSEVEQRVLTAYCGALLDSEDKAKAMERAVQAYMSAGGKGDPAPAVKEAQAEIAASASYLKVSCLLWLPCVCQQCCVVRCSSPRTRQSRRRLPRLCGACMWSKGDATTPIC